MSGEVFTLITAGVVFSTAVVALMGKLRQIHVLVNDRMTQALDRIDQLEETIRDAGLPTPPKLDSDG